MSVLPSDIVYYGSMYDPAFDGATTLNGAIVSTGAATFAVNIPTSPFPAAGSLEFAVQVDSEIMLVTQGAPGNAAGTVTVIRGFGGTSAATHSTGAAVTMPAGGGIDFTSKVAFSDVVAGHTIDIIAAASTDVFSKLTIQGRDSTGVLQAETLTLNGQTAVTGAQVWDRIEAVYLAASASVASQITAGGTTLAVTGHAGYPTAGNYTIKLGKEIMTVTGGQNTNSWTVTRGVGGTTATVHQAGDPVYMVPFNDVMAFDHTKILSARTMQAGSAQSTGTTPALAKLQAGDGATVAIGQIIRTTGGTGPQQIRTIIAVTGYGTDFVAVSRDWGTLPDNTTTYDVVNGVQLDASPNQITEVRRFLWNAASDVPGGSQLLFYQKVFAVNNNTTIALTAATVQDAANTATLPGSAKLDLATATAANDTVTWANRQTVPGSGYGAFSVQPLATSYGANSGNLASGAAPNSAGSQGIVLRLTLPAGTSPYKGYADLRTMGNTI